MRRQRRAISGGPIRPRLSMIYIGIPFETRRGSAVPPDDPRPPPDRQRAADRGRVDQRAARLSAGRTRGHAVPDVVDGGHEQPQRGRQREYLRAALEFLRALPR